MLGAGLPDYCLLLSDGNFERLSWKEIPGSRREAVGMVMDIFGQWKRVPVQAHANLEGEEEFQRRKLTYTLTLHDAAQ